MLFDMHTHFIPPEVLLWIKDNQHLVHAKWEKKHHIKQIFLPLITNGDLSLKSPLSIPDYTCMSKRKLVFLTPSSHQSPSFLCMNFPEDVTSELSAVYNFSLAN